MQRIYSTYIYVFSSNKLSYKTVNKYTYLLSQCDTAINNQANYILIFTNWRQLLKFGKASSFIN